MHQIHRREPKGTEAKPEFKEQYMYVELGGGILVLGSKQRWCPKGMSSAIVLDKENNGKAINIACWKLIDNIIMVQYDNGVLGKYDPKVFKPTEGVGKQPTKADMTNVIKENRNSPLSI